MSDEQVTCINHVKDLDRKLSSARFNVDQLSVGRDAFVNMLAQSLQSEEVTDADYDEPAVPAD
jgi:hypothetical protein